MARGKRLIAAPESKRRIKAWCRQMVADLHHLLAVVENSAAAWSTALSQLSGLPKHECPGHVGVLGHPWQCTLRRFVGHGLPCGRIEDLVEADGGH
jgi:hypothetical protein